MNTWRFEPTVKREGDLIMHSRGFAIAAGAGTAETPKSGSVRKDARAARKGIALRLVA